MLQECLLSSDDWSLMRVTDWALQANGHEARNGSAFGNHAGSGFPGWEQDGQRGSRRGSVHFAVRDATSMSACT